MKPSHLEEALEGLKDIPKEFSDASTRLRELDLQVQNAIDEQCNRMEEFFRNANNVDPKERDKMFQSSMQFFDVIIDDADAKCKLADQMHKGLRMCLNKIDDKIADFKMDLEFSDPGMAGIIERKVEAEEESEATSVVPKKKKRNTKKDTKKNKW